jgi:hypothetical protein
VGESDVTFICGGRPDNPGPFSHPRLALPRRAQRRAAAHGRPGRAGGRAGPGSVPALRAPPSKEMQDARPQSIQPPKGWFGGISSIRTSAWLGWLGLGRRIAQPSSRCALAALCTAIVGAPRRHLHRRFGANGSAQRLHQRRELGAIGIEARLRGCRAEEVAVTVADHSHVPLHQAGDRIGQRDQVLRAMAGEAGAAAPSGACAGRACAGALDGTGEAAGDRSVRRMSGMALTPLRRGECGADSSRADFPIQA